MSSLLVQLKLPDPHSPTYNEQLNAALASWTQQQARYLENVLLTQTNAPLRVPDTTIDAGSADYGPFGSAANAKNAFSRLQLPNTATTTSATFQTALNYTGKGMLLCVVGVSQNSGGTSTAAGMSVQITIDGVQVYSAASLSAVNHMIAVVGQLCLLDPTNEYFISLNGPGLTFNKSCLVEFKSGTAVQGVQVGWRVLKLH